MPWWGAIAGCHGRVPLLGAMVGCHGRVPLLGATVLGCTVLRLCYLGSMLVYLFLFKYSIYIYSVLMFVSCLEIFL